MQTLTAAEYLPGVVRGEMPATFELEALKAQAVAERTYLYYRMTGGEKAAHPDADVCTDSNCCTAWLSEEDARAKWGDKFDQYETKVQQAVAETDGQVVLYDGAPIMAVFHSSSGRFHRRQRRRMDGGAAVPCQCEKPGGSGQRAQLLQRQHLHRRGVPHHLLQGPTPTPSCPVTAAAG